MSVLVDVRVQRMLDVVSLAIPLVAGISLGFLLREKKRVDFGKVTFGAIVALIFSLGFSIGSNSELLESLPKVGLSAVVILFLAIFFSVVFVKAVRKMVRME